MYGGVGTLVRERSVSRTGVTAVEAVLPEPQAQLAEGKNLPTRSDRRGILKSPVRSSAYFFIISQNESKVNSFSALFTITSKFPSPEGFMSSFLRLGSDENHVS